MTKLELQVAQLVRKELGLSQVPTLDQDFEDDLGGDSLDTIEIIMATEKAFNVDIPDEDAERAKSVRKLVAVLVRRANLVNE